MVLDGGIKGWATAGEEYIYWMDDYDVAVWSK
jgi:arsenical-resistance protein 2